MFYLIGWRLFEIYYVFCNYLDLNIVSLVFLLFVSSLGDFYDGLSFELEVNYFLKLFVVLLIVVNFFEVVYVFFFGLIDSFFYELCIKVV